VTRLTLVYTFCLVAANLEGAVLADAVDETPETRVNKEGTV
jgi:hypothetical protein